MSKLSTTLDNRRLEKYITEAMVRWEVPGLSIAIVKDGSTVLAKGYGSREVGKDLPVDEHTLFAISGATPSFTASALAILVGQRKLDWNDRLFDFLPSVKSSDYLLESHTTIIDALAYRAGLPMEVLSYAPHPDLSRADLLDRIQYIEPTMPFRTAWSPNLLLTVAAGEIIPALTGISWDDFVTEQLFRPIGMKDSVTGPHLLDGHKNLVTPHETIDGVVSPIPHTNTSNIGPATAIYTSADDMARWLKFQLNNGKVGDKNIIDDNEITMMRSSHIAGNFDFPGISKNFLNQGLGLIISDSISGHKLYSGGGNADGLESYYAFLPELELGVAVMINSAKVMPQPLIAWIIDQYTNAPYRDWVNEFVPFYEQESAAAISGLIEYQKTITDPTKKPTQPMASYAGVYQHSLLGKLTIEVVDGGVSFILGTSYVGELIHANHDTFFIQVTTPYLGQFFFNGAAQFRLDEMGQVSSMFAMGKEFKKICSQ